MRSRTSGSCQLGQRLGMLPGLLVVLLVGAGPARSAGLGLRWDACYGEGTGQFIREFACNTNAGYERLVGSFASPQDAPIVSGLEIVLDVVTCPFIVGTPCSAVLPEWWKFHEVGTRRRTSLTASFENDPANVVCAAWEPGATAGAIAGYSIDAPTSGSARLRLAVAAYPDMPGLVSAEQEYTAFTLTVDHRATVGTGSCEGCGTGLALFLNATKIVTPSGANDIVVWGPFGDVNSNFVFWQSQPTAAARSSWGAVKALYR